MHRPAFRAFALIVCITMAGFALIGMIVFYPKVNTPAASVAPDVKYDAPSAPTNESTKDTPFVTHAPRDSDASTMEAAPSPAPSKTEDAPPIAGSDILRVKVQSVGIDVAVSGETFPRKTPRCKGAETCIDPPVPNEAAWYGSVPAVPSTDSVKLFGHLGSELYPEFVTFNGLPEVKDGDDIVVTTKTGIFTYRAEDAVLVPYADIPYSWMVWGNEPDRVVLVTCNDQTVATVVQGWLVDTKER